MFHELSLSHASVLPRRKQPYYVKLSWSNKQRTLSVARLFGYSSCSHQWSTAQTCVGHWRQCTIRKGWVVECTFEHPFNGCRWQTASGWDYVSICKTHMSYQTHVWCRKTEPVRDESMSVFGWIVMENFDGIKNQKCSYFKDVY